MLTRAARTGLNPGLGDVTPGQPLDGESEHPTAARLDEAVSSAYALLYHAASSGKEVPLAVRGPIINLRAALAANEPIASGDESAFLDAYARLAVLAAPATAETLRATSRGVGRAPWWARLLRLGPVSDAQRFAWVFGILAVCLVGAVGVAEWTRTYIATVVATKKLFDASVRELQSTDAAMQSIEGQIISLRGRTDGQDARAVAVAVDILTRQQQELSPRQRLVHSNNEDLFKSLYAGYRSLNRVILFAGPDEIPDIIAPVGHTVTGYLLPVLYGALGTCAFILRSLYSQMVDRSFDPRRSGEFVVRLFLGMLSGVTVQWVFAKEGMPDGTTPLVLAFLAGYSVELLFSGMDRLLAAVTGRLRPSHASPRTGRTAGAGGVVVVNGISPPAIKG
jgi:hypothetical protein